MKKTELHIALIFGSTLLLAPLAHAQLTHTEIRKLIADDPEKSAFFGYSVALDGDTAVIGAWGTDNGGISTTGSAYVFVRAGGTWTQQAKLLASDKATEDYFGISVAIDGDTALIGAPGEDDSGNDGNGAVYVFTRSAGSWSQQAKLLASDKANQDWFGGSIAIVGDTAVIGAYLEDDSGTEDNGAAYVFTRSAGTWTEQTKLLPSDKASSDNFGSSVAIDGDEVIIGAPGSDDGATDGNGAAYVFTRSAGTWTEQAKLLASDRIHGGRFGSKIAIDGNSAVINSGREDDSGTVGNGAAYVFTRTAGIWIEQAKLLASDMGDWEGFGRSVAIDGDTALIGASGEDDSGTEDNGAAYVFTRSAGHWTEQAKLLASDKATSDLFGIELALEGDTALIGGRITNAVYEFDTGQLGSPPAGPVLSIEGSPTVVEGQFLQFLLTLSEPASENVSFDIESVDETATTPEDYDSKSGRRLLAAGETRRSIWVRTVDDSVYEREETLRLALSNVKNASLGRASTTGTITDNDIEPAVAVISVAGSRAAEGEYAKFEVRLSEPTTEDVVFSVRTINGSAVAGEDFDAKSGNRSIAAGATRKTVWVKLKSDNQNEGQEQFQLQANAVSDNVVNGFNTATGTIIDVFDGDTGAATLSVDDARATEGQYARFAVRLSESVDSDVVFSVRTINGTATAGEDFAAKSGNRTIAAGQTEKTIWVQLKTDGRNEAQEQFTLEIDALSDNAVNGNVTAIGTIDDR